MHRYLPHAQAHAQTHAKGAATPKHQHPHTGTQTYRLIIAGWRRFLGLELQLLHMYRLLFELSEDTPRGNALAPRGTGLPFSLNKVSVRHALCVYPRVRIVLA